LRADGAGLRDWHAGQIEELVTMKATRAIVQQRVEELLRIRLGGAGFWRIREYVRHQEAEKGSPFHLAEGHKPLSDSQLWRYLARAERLIAESCHASRQKLLAQHLAQRQKLFQRAVEKDDQKTALAILDSTAHLAGIWDAEVREALDRLRREILIRFGAQNRSPGGVEGTRTLAGPAPVDQPGTYTTLPAEERPGPDPTNGPPQSGPLAATITPLELGPDAPAM
jgi:hypothetical protein